MSLDLVARARQALLPSAPGPGTSTLLLRLAVGFVFVTSGTVKFLFDNQGAGRFARIGLSPGLAAFVGAVEISCGVLLAFGLVTRLAAIPLVVDMVVAILTTKIPLLLGPGPEPVAALPKIGFWAFAYQARLDVTMLLACAYLVSAGAGAMSLDVLVARRRSPSRADALGPVEAE
jgi:putative oxidoreductase